MKSAEIPRKSAWFEPASAEGTEVGGLVVMANVDVARFGSNARYPVVESEASSGSCSVEGPEVGLTVRREVLRTTAHGHQIDHLRQNGRLMALTISIPR